VTLRYVLERIAWALLVLLGSSVLIFLIMHVIPGDPAQAMLGPEGTPEAVETLRRQLGLDQPLWWQYYHWISRALVGDLGQSILLSQSVLSLLVERLPVTLALSFYALALAVFIALPASMISATRPGSVADNTGRFAALFGLAMPNFWLGLVLVLIFSVHLRWFPVFGYVPFFEDPARHFSHLVIPVVSLGAGYAAMILETSRNSLIEVLRQDYVRTARAGGLSERRVLWKYALRNALIPIITVIGIQVGYLMSGAVIIENVFAIPGMGRLLVNAVLSRDYPVVQGAMLVIVLIFSLANLVVDLLCMSIDPRVARRT
jgi:peptide/nickel transport system permease protein